MLKPNIFALFLVRIMCCRGPYYVYFFLLFHIPYPNLETPRSHFIFCGLSSKCFISWAFSMERRLRLLDHVYRRNVECLQLSSDPKRIEGRIISAEEDGGDEMKYIVFFPGEVNYYYYFESELCLCSDTVDTIFPKGVLCCFHCI